MNRSQATERESPTLERLLRCRWAWVLVLFLGWAVSPFWLVRQLSHFWYGRPGYALILMAPIFAPQGLLSLLSLQNSPYAVIYFFAAHAAFWSLFVGFLVRLPRLKLSTLYVMSAVILLIVTATLAGCAQGGQQIFDL